MTRSHVHHDRERRPLLIVPHLRAQVVGDGRVRLTEKFLDGVLSYAQLWDGPLSVVMRVSREEDSNLDHVDVNPKDLPFALMTVESLKDDSALQQMRNAGIVLVSAGDEQHHVSAACREAGVPSVYVTEYTLKTKRQINNATVRNPVRRWRRHLWLTLDERKLLKALATANGLQCNGTPTYEAYRDLNPNRLLYFDARFTADMLARDEHVIRRAHGDPMRLLFSGRLLPMKGADHLIEVAHELRHLGVSFELTICGGGDCEDGMRADIQRYGLQDSVKMAGVLDFKTELMPLVRDNCDLFVCCHRQGDPSCTYLETMACGVPIAGYANEAFEGLIRRCDAGWLSPIDRPRLLAETIARLSHERETITKMGLRALAFARQHTFNMTFQRRIEHLRQIVSNEDETVADCA